MFSRFLSSKRSLIVSYSAIFVLASALGLISVVASIFNAKQLNQVIQDYSVQEKLVNDMHTAARERVVTSYRIVLEDDPFIREELFQLFNEKGTNFILARNRLLDMPIDPELHQLILLQDQITQPLGLLNRKMADLAMQDELPQAQALMSQQAADLQEQTFAYYRQMGQAIKLMEDQAISKATDYRRWTERIILISVLIILTVVVRSAFKSIKKEIQNENKLIQAQRRSEVTLKSLPDGVILCDLNYEITDMNPVAESILGLSLYNCAGQSLIEVLQRVTGVDDVVKGCTDPQAGVCQYNFQIPMRGGVNRDIDLTVTQIILDKQTIGYVVVLSDVSLLANENRELAHLASHDPLTGTFNRREFEVIVKGLQMAAQQHPDSTDWLCYVDLDDFKTVNDKYGHEAGDAVLREISKRITDSVRSTDMVFRVGGDEFSAIFRNCDDEQADQMVHRLLGNILDEPISWKAEKLKISASIGLLKIINGYESISDIVADVDSAMYNAKKGGKGQYVRAHKN